MKKVGDIVRGRQLLFVADSATVYEAACYMADKKIGAMPVLAGDRLVGVFSERDLMTRVVVAGRTAESTRIGEVMTREVVTADLDESRDECLAKMQRAGCRHLPVLAHGHVIAMVSIRDLLWDEIEEQVEEIRQLRAYVWQTPPA